MGRSGAEWGGVGRSGGGVGRSGAEWGGVGGALAGYERGGEGTASLRGSSVSCAALKTALFTYTLTRPESFPPPLPASLPPP